MNFLEPHKVAQHFGISEGMHVADFTVGAGFFVLPMAKFVGKYGRVYAFDTNTDLVHRVVSQGKENGHHNIIHIEGDLFSGEMVLPDYVDLILITNPFSKEGREHAIFAHAYRHLKPQGKLIVIDYINPEQNKFQTIEYAGFLPQREFNAGNYHQGMVFKKI